MEPNTRVTLMSFADSRMKNALKTLRGQAEAFGVFSDIHTLTERDLDPDFLREYGRRLSRETPGYGYWLWKPQVIRQVLKTLSDGDVLLYLDAGCRLNQGGLDRFLDYLDDVKRSESGILASQLDFVEKYWTKPEVFRFFGVEGDSKITDTGQMQSGLVFLRVQESTREFVDTWLNTMTSDEFLINNAPSRLDLPDGFVKHRHDQSVFSVMAKIHGAIAFSADEVWAPKVNVSPNRSYRDWSQLADYPIHAKREIFTPLRKTVVEVQKYFAKLRRRTFRWVGTRLKRLWG